MSFWAIFCPFTQLLTLKIKIWKECQVTPLLLLFWAIFCTFTLLATWKIKIVKNEKKAWRYYNFTLAYHKWQSFDVWFLRYGARQTELFLILDNFLPFYPTNNPENQNFEKMKNKPRYIIILHKCTINENHMMYGSWDMKRDREKFWKKMKKMSGDIIHKCTKNHDHVLYCSWEMARNGCNFYFSFWAFFFLPF